MKTLMFYFILMMTFLGVNAQEQPLKNFKVIKRTMPKEVWIVPQNIEQAIEPLRQEAIEKQFDLMGGRDTLPDWLDFTISHKDSISHADVYEEWEELIPAPLKDRLKKHETEIVPLNTNYLEVFALANDKGKIQSVYFRLDPQVLDLVKKEELQGFSDTIMKKGIDPREFDFRHYTTGQTEKFLKTIKENPDLREEERLEMMHELMNQQKKCTRGIIRLIVMTRHSL